MIESRRGEEEAEHGLSLKATFSEKLFDVAPLSVSAAAPEPGRVLKKKKKLFPCHLRLHN